MNDLREALVKNLRSTWYTDRYTRLHSLDVSRLTQRLGVLLGYEGDGLKELKLAGKVHDSGKLMVPRPILYKPEPLSDAEWVALKAHPQTGACFAEMLGGSRLVIEAISQHHERLDGSGYPFGLTDREITEHARIVAVADVYCAMTHRRPYREPLSKEDALEYLHTQGLFDRDVVQALQALVNCRHFRNQESLYMSTRAV